MDLFDRRKASAFFLAGKSGLLSSDSASDSEKLKTVFEICDLMGDPRPPSELELGFIHKSVSGLLVVSLWNRLVSQQDYQAIPEENRPRFYDLLTAAGPRTRARILGPHGIYPNTPIAFESADYYCHHRIPVLATYSPHASELSPELEFINELELRAGAAILLAHERGLFHFYFEPGGSIEFSSAATERMSTGDRRLFIYELLTRLVQPETKARSFGVPRSAIQPDMYTYEVFGDVEAARALYEHLHEGDELLLRTCFYLCKGSMLWWNQAFAEDAIANVMFAIEGALLLYQRKNDGSEGQIDLKYLERLFARDFENGGSYFDFIKEGYEKRIAIVHPSPFGEPDWSPWLSAEDFYDYFRIAVALLNWIILDRRIDW